MKKIAIAPGILVLLALLVAAAGWPAATTATVWGVVETSKTDSCGPLTDFVEPCPGCQLWLDWQGQPLTPGVSARLTGSLVTFNRECEVLVVSSRYEYNVPPRSNNSSDEK
jgi:hypothetical protein